MQRELSVYESLQYLKTKGLISTTHKITPLVITKRMKKIQKKVFNQKSKKIIK